MFLWKTDRLRSLLSWWRLTAWMTNECFFLYIRAEWAQIIKGNSKHIVGVYHREIWWVWFNDVAPSNGMWGVLDVIDFMVSDIQVDHPFLDRIFPTNMESISRIEYTEQRWQSINHSIRPLQCPQQFRSNQNIRYFWNFEVSLDCLFISRYLL